MEERSKNLTTGEKQSLRARHKRERDKRLADRIKFILLKDQGWSYSQIAEALLIDDQALRNWWEEYTRNGIEGLLIFKYEGRASKLSKAQKAELTVHLAEKTYLTSYQVIEYIKSRYGVIYSRKGVTSLLHKLEFEYKKPKLVPGEVDIVKQVEFVAVYEEIKTKAQTDEEILFLDGMHPTHNARSGYGWIKKGHQKQIRTNSGRGRININGALNLKREELIYRDEETINSYSCAYLIMDILNKYPKAKKIHLIMDNASYNRSKLMKCFAENKRLNFIYLPPYSPNLNPIERLWRLFHKKVTNCKYYKTFREFKEAAFAFLDDIGKYKAEFRSLINDNFHINHPNPNISTFISA